MCKYSNCNISLLKQEGSYLCKYSNYNITLLKQEGSYLCKYPNYNISLLKQEGSYLCKYPNYNIYLLKYLLRGALFTLLGCLYMKMYITCVCIWKCILHAVSIYS